MSLRYRLFLWVSGLFIVISICGYFTENYVTERELAKAQKSFKQEVVENSEKKRLDFQSLLASSISEETLRLNAILSNISSFSPQALRFAPTTWNEKRGTWGESSDLLLEYKWIDFIQNTSGVAHATAIVPLQNALQGSYRIAIDEELAWVFYDGKEQPYLGVKVPYTSHFGAPSFPEEALDQLSGTIPEAYLLFDVQGFGNPDLKRLPLFKSEVEWSPIPVKWTEGYQLEVESFVRAIQRARKLLLDQKIHPPLSSVSSESSESFIRSSNDFPLLPSEQLIQKKMQRIALRYTEINMIWLWIALFDRGLFGQDLFAFPSPFAVGVFLKGDSTGISVGAKDVLFDKKIFDDASYYQMHFPKNAQTHLATSIAVIPFPSSNQVFFGNTAQFRIKTPKEEKTGYLTLGIDARSILQRLVLATHQTAVLAYQGIPLNAMGEAGEKIDLKASDATSSGDLPYAEILATLSGIIPWRGENYFYLVLRPFPDIDLAVILFNLESREFALLHDLESGSERVIDSIRLNTHLSGFIALIIAVTILHNLARNITQPIVQLAESTKGIQEGRFEDVKRSLPRPKHQDEVATLCRSFYEMVQGLEEREKVKGVLNKVVSPEIAQEILRGSIHLGGEEKRVTVFFADIRGFTELTQNMPPQKVIELLNTCMTKISKVVDQNQGVIDKYVGDEAMALFGAPISHGEDAYNAIVSALQTIDAITQWNAERKVQGEPPIEIGIGIHTGNMLAGNMGAENRLNYTVIGSSVNLAFRLCSAAKKMEILVTKETLDEPGVKERIHYEPLPLAQFKGFDGSREVFRVLYRK